MFIDKRLNAEILSEFSISNEIIQLSTVKITFGNLNFIIIGVYRPHSGNIKDFTNKLLNILTNINLQHQKIFILGDFNINLLNDDNDILLFKTEMNALSFSSLISKPTRFPPGNSFCLPSLLDHIWTNSLIDCYSGIILKDLSDHCPTFVNIPLDKEVNSNIKIKFRDYSEINTSNFCNAVADLDWNNIITCDINLSMNKFEECLNDLHNAHFPIKTKIISSKRKMKPWLTSGILKSVKTKSRYFKLYKLGLMNETTYKNYKNKFTSMLRCAKENYYRILFINNKKNSRIIWSTFKDLLGKNKEMNILQKVRIGDSDITDENQIANAFNSFFSSIGPNLDINLPHINKSHSDFMPPTVPQSFFLNPTTPDEICGLLLKLKKKKTDINSVPLSILMKIRHLICFPLSRLINLSFLSGVFPDRLKIAKIVPIHKAGQLDDINNFRPISILPTFSKLFEKCMANRLISFLDKFRIISNHQFGFQKGKTTTQAIQNFISHVYDSFNKKNHSIGVFLDFKKAFDTVNHKILISKLENYGIRGIPKNWFISYLENRLQRVSIGNTFSQYNAIKTGVPQGSILGPILFILYINDLPQVSKKIHTTMFADDSSLIASHKNFNQLVQDINLDMVRVYEWTLCNRLSLNLNKTVCMLFTKRKVRDIDTFSIKINNADVPFVQCHKFLGVNLDNKLSFKKHVESVVNKASKSIGIFYKTKSFLSKNLLTTLYYSLIYPYFLYANEIWGGTYPTYLQSILLLQKRIVRIINKESFLAHTTPLFIESKILRISDIHKLVIAQMGFKSNINSDNLPAHNYNTRNRNILRPEFQRLSICQKSITYKLPVIWNSLPDHLKHIEKYNRFKFELKKHLLSSYSSQLN